MAKKVRKPRASNPRTYSQTPSTPAAPAASGASTPSKAASGGKSSAQAVGAPKTVDLAAEYAVVGGDLRRLLITAGVMFAVLIAVNFIFTFLT